MSGKIEKTERKEIACFVCHKTEHEGVLLPCRRRDKISGYVPGAYPCSFTAAKTTECGVGMQGDILRRSWNGSVCKGLC